MIAISRRTLLAGMATAGWGAPFAVAAAAPTIVVNKDPNCGCCSGWVEHLRAAGFDATVNDLNDLAPLKSRLMIPPALASCHTAEIGGYVIEGHVPASAIRRLLSERPAATGLAVPGMPVGSPGMEVPGSPDEIYNVILFGRTVQKIFARFNGTQEITPGP